MQEETLPVLPLLQEEAPKAVFDYTVDDARIEFYAQGSWEAQAAEQLSFTFAPAQPPSIELLVPFFSQKVDLSLWFLLNNSWYFEAAFADGFNKNTVGAGYYGDGFVKHARISNRNIRLSQNHALQDIGRGDNQAPGISIQAGKDNWAADAFVRYDAYAQRSKTFTGKKEIGEILVPSESWLRSIFSLPSEITASSVSDIFVEDEEGLYEHVSGKKLSKLNRGEYIISPSENILILKKEYAGLILAVISSQGTNEQTLQRITDELGSFSSGGFLHKVQDEFSSTDALYGMEQYSYGGIQGEGFFSHIKGIEEPILLIQNPPFFSPFSCARYYEITADSIDRVSVVLTDGKAASQKLQAEISRSSQIYRQLTSSKKELIEVYRISEETSTLFPFAPFSPSIYLSHGSGPDSLYSLSVSSSTSVSSYDIGTDAVEGTITVIKNGIEEKNFIYDAKKGIVIFELEPKETDTITISWKEESDGFEQGFVTLAGGITISISPVLNITGGLSIQYPVIPGFFSTLDETNEGIISAAAGIQYSNKGFSLQNTIQFNAVNANPAGFLRIEGMERGGGTTYLGKNSVVMMSSAEVPVLNPRGTEILPLLSLENIMTDTALEAVTDSEVTSYAFQTSWHSEQGDLQTAWTAVEIDLSSRALELQNAELFAVAFKEVSFTADNDYDIFIQLGNAEQAMDHDLYERRIGTWKVSRKAHEQDSADVIQSVIVCSSFEGWQTAQIKLNERDRSLIQTKPFARIIFVQHLSPPATGIASASVLTGPYEISVPRFETSGEGSYTYTSLHASSMNQEGIKRFNPKGNNTVQHLAWSKTGELDVQRTLYYRKFIGDVSLNGYKKMGFFLFVNDPLSFSSVTISLNAAGEAYSVPVYSLTINSADVQNFVNTWIPVEIDLETQSVSINGQSTNILFINEGRGINPPKPNTLEAAVITSEQKSGVILFDELYASGTDLRYAAENRLVLSYNHEEPLLSVGEMPLISGVAAHLVSDQSYSFSQYNFSSPVSADAALNIIMLSISGGISSVYSASNLNTAPLTSAVLSRMYHSVSTLPLFMPFTVLSLTEDFTLSPVIKTSQKANTASLNLLKIRFPFSCKFQTKTIQLPGSAEQKASGQVSLSFPGKYTTYTILTDASLEQKTPYGEQAVSYSRAWTDASKLQFSDASGSFKRKEEALLSQSILLPFLTLRPSLTVHGVHDYSSMKDPFQSSLFSIKTDIPFSLLRQQFVISHTKELTVKNKTEGGGTYYTDIQTYSQVITQSQWFFKELIIKDLYNPLIFSTMNDVNVYNGSLLYTSLYTAAWKRPLMLSAIDFFVPSLLEAGIARSVMNTAYNQGTDALKITGEIGFTSFNSFGKFSSKPLFSFYEQDELISTWKGEFQFDKNTGILIDYSIIGFEQYTIFISDKNSIQQSGEFSFSGRKKLALKLGALWNRNGSNSPLSYLIMLITPVNKEDIFLVRQTGLDYNLEIHNTGSHTILAFHEWKSTIHTYLTVSAKVSASFIFSSTRLEKIDVQGVIGTKLLF